MFSSIKKHFLKAPLLLFGSLAAFEAPCFDYAYNVPTCNGSDCLWTGQIDYLYLEARSDFTPYQTIVGPSLLKSGAEVAVEKGFPSIYRMPQEFNYESRGGFRVGLGANLPRDQWRIELDWLHFRTCASLSDNAPSVNSGQGTFISPVGELNSTFDVFDSDFFNGTIDVRSDVHVNLLDLDLSREFVLTLGINLKPVIALAGLDIKSTYSGLIAIPAQNVRSSEVVNIDLKTRFKALGVKVGLDSFWEIGCGLGIFGESRLGLLYGRYETIGTPLSSSNIASVRLVHHDVIPTFEFSLGLGWEKCFCDGSEVNVKLGWEGFYFYDQTNLYLTPEIVSSPLTLQGLVIGVSYSM